MYIPYITNTGPRHSGTSPISQELVPVFQVLPTGPYPPDIYPISHVLVPVLPVYPQYHKYWTLFYRYIPYISNTGLYHSVCPVLPVHHLYLKYLPCPTGTSPISKVLDLRYRYITYITVLALFYRYITFISSTCPVLPVHPLYQKYWTCATGTSPIISKVLNLRYWRTFYKSPWPSG